MRASTDPQALGLWPGLAEAGFDAAGVLEASRYDDRVPPAWRCRAVAPGARSVVVLATGGRAFFAAFESAPESQSGGPDPLDAFTLRVVREAARDEQSRSGLGAAACSFERREGVFADFVALGRASGLVAPSRLALGVHPRFGPWLAIRALLFTGRPLAPTAADPAFDPCTGCAAPCADACPGQALPASGFDLAACAATSARLADCRAGCAARRACVLGPLDRYTEAAEAFHRRAALAATTGG